MARVLIVDDSIIMRRNLKSILKDGGHLIVAEASNGQEAYERYKEYKPDIVTMDITMPILNGIESVKKIIAEFPDAKIIMISALNQRNKVFEALNNGAKNYIVKPISPSKLLSTINNALEERSITDNSIKETPKELAKEVVIPNEKTPESFVINNKNGVFYLDIDSTIKNESIVSLEAAIHGLLFIKPLTIVVNISNFKDIDEEINIRLVRLMKKVQEVEGTVKLFNSKGDFPDFVKKYSLNTAEPLVVKDGYIVELVKVSNL